MAYLVQPWVDDAVLRLHSFCLSRRQKRIRHSICCLWRFCNSDGFHNTSSSCLDSQEKSMKTPQQVGREWWEPEVARTLGGRVNADSGARAYSILDVQAGLVAVEAKYTAAESFRVTPNILDSIARQALGPSAASHASGVLAICVGDQRRRLAVVDLDELVSWLKAPPGLLEATRQDQLRATARAPSLLR